MLVNTSKTDSE